MLSFLGNRAEGREYYLLSADRLDIEYSQLDKARRDPYAPGYTGRWKERAAVRFDISVLDYVYWRNNVHTETINTGQVKTVGWEWELGLPLTKYFDFYFRHHSRHIMDEPPQTNNAYPGTRTQFPVEDEYGIRFKFIHKDK